MSDPIRSLARLIAETDTELLVADGFEQAFIGIVYRCADDPIACYDREKCLKILMKRDGMTEEEAEEFFEFNIGGAWVGDLTPCYLQVMSMN
ncbi:MAG: hypothetical protein ACYC63_04915 [Armatimonadota bacterium]